MNETTFENAKVGDSVWDLVFGWGIVEAVKTLIASEDPIFVRFCTKHPFVIKAGGVLRSYPYTGINDFGIRTLFWDEIKFEAPPRPNRKIKKVVEGWVNIRKSDNNLEFGPIWRNKSETEGGRHPDNEYVGDPLFIHHEYEVEE